MDFRLTEEQEALADVAADLFADASGPDRLRAVWDAGGDRDDLWPRLAELGLPAVGLPARHGGAGGGLVDLVRVCEEAGYAALPEPLVPAVAVAAPLLAEAGTDEHRRRWLPRLASGEAVAAVRLDGQPHVRDADRAGVLLLETDGGLRLCEPGSLTLERLPSEDRARRLFTVASAGDGPPGAGLPGAGAALARAHRRARTATAAALNGVSRRLVEMAVEHARVREQFGRPIGGFQALQHLLADLHVAVDAVRPAAWYAAYAIDRDRDDADAASRIAKAAAAEAHAEVSTGALQTLGGIGFTWEHDLHLWLKRGRALQALHGTPREHRRVLAAHLLDRTPRP